MSDGTPAWLWTRWMMPPETAASLLTLLLAYGAGIGPLKPRSARAESADTTQIVAFIGGLLAMFLVLSGPIADLAGTFLFSAHMVQHLVLTLLSPPLLLLGTPGWLLRPFLGFAPLARTARFVTGPWIAVAVFSITMTAWHLPGIYDLALASRGAHALMHVTLVASAIVGWWPLLSPVPELPRPAPPLQLLYLAILGAPMVAVSALVTLADHPLYSYYAAAPRLWGTSPVDDQRIGGLLMWVPAHVGLVWPFTIVFFRWAKRELTDEDSEEA